MFPSELLNKFSLFHLLFFVFNRLVFKRPASGKRIFQILLIQLLNSKIVVKNILPGKTYFFFPVSFAFEKWKTFNLASVLDAFMMPSDCVVLTNLLGL